MSVFVSMHAIDRISTRVMDRYEDTALPDEGMWSWARRLAARALNTPRISLIGDAYAHFDNGIVWVFSPPRERDPIRKRQPVLRTVMAETEETVLTLSDGERFEAVYGNELRVSK